MWKYLRLVFVFVPKLIWAYFAWIFAYSRHPEKYPLSQRYAKAHKLCLQFVKDIRLDVHHQGLGYIRRQKPQYIIVNHFGFLDPIVIMAITDKHLLFVAKKEAKKMPFIGRILQSIDAVFLNREDLKQEVKAMSKVKKILQGGRTVVIFPEGTRNRKYSADLGMFKPGAFKVPEVLDVEIVPVAVIGTQFALLLSTNWKTFPIEVLIMPPYLPSSEKLGSVGLSKKFQELMQSMVNDIREKENNRISAFLTKRQKELISD